MAILHELASAGIHEQSDEECVDGFDVCRTTFEYVFAKMRIEIEEAKAYAEGMAELVRKRVNEISREPGRLAPATPASGSVWKTYVF